MESSPYNVSPVYILSLVGANMGLWLGLGALQFLELILGKCYSTASI